MIAGKRNLVIERGVTLVRHLVARMKQSQEPLDLTGYTVRMMVREDYDSLEPAIDASTDNGKITLEPLLGIITITISDTETTALTIESGVWDMEMVSPSGQVTRLVQGKVKVSKEVTR